MEYCSYSPRFQEVASLYIKDSKVIKYRGHDLEDATGENIIREISHKNKVIVEKDKILYCYFKEEDKHIIENLITELKDKFNMVHILDCIKIEI